MSEAGNNKQDFKSQKGKTNPHRLEFNELEQLF